MERSESELFNFGNTKQKIERLQVAVKESEAQKQELQSQIDVLRQELESVKNEKHRPTLTDRAFLTLCESGDVEIVEEAIMNGADVNAKSNDGRTALMNLAASAAASDKTAELLLKHSADVNAADNEGMTALIDEYNGSGKAWLP